MLCGSRSAQIEKLRLDKLSTFGLLSYLKQAEVVDFIQSLIRADLLEQSERQPRRPIVHLTELGGEVMRGKRELPANFTIPRELAIRLRKPTARPVPPPHVTENRPDHSLANRTHQSTLVSRETSMPPAMREVVSDVEDSHEAAPTVDMAAPHPSHDPSVTGFASGSDERSQQQQPDYYWTWRLLDDGYSVEECLAIRRISPQVLIVHLNSATLDGLALGLSWIDHAEACCNLETRRVSEDS